MLTRIDHLVIAVPDPDRATAELERRVGVRASGGGRHEPLGTFNRLAWLGDTYLELIGVFDRGLAERSWIGMPVVRTLDATGGRGGLATFAVTSDALASDLDRLRRLGASWEGPLPGERLRPDGRLVRWSVALPPRLGPDEPPFLIEHDPTAAEWTSAERSVRAEEVHPRGGPVRLEALEIPVSDVRRIVNRYLRSLGLLFRPSLAGSGARDAEVGQHTIRLRRARFPVPRTEPGTDRSEDAPIVRLRAPGDGRQAVKALECWWIVRGEGQR